MQEYNDLMESRLTGWNTWNVRSMLSHVLMPHGFAISIGIKEYKEGDYLKEALIGRLGGQKYAQRMYGGTEEVFPGAHSFNGDYTQITVKWKDIQIEVETASIKEEIYIKIMPTMNQKTKAAVVAEAGIFWNKPGTIYSKEGSVIMSNSAKEIYLHSIGKKSNDCSIPSSAPYLESVLDGAVYFYTGDTIGLGEIEKIIIGKREEHFRKANKADIFNDYYQSIEHVLAWNIIYDPKKNRILTPVSRTWSVEWGGYVQHCWDMYFNALMYSISDKELSYISAVEITREHAADGFIPCCVAANGFSTLDRSQPPVGSLVAKKIYEKYKETWFLEALYDILLLWNKWYFENRQVGDGVLGWGSKPFETRLDNYWETAGVGEFYGAAMESGLDNSPMYDNIPIDPETHNMMLADVGLTSLFIADSLALAEIAGILGKDKDIQTIEERIAVCKAGLETLWCEKEHIYLNYKTAEKCFDHQLSPTNFYPLLTGMVDAERAQKMIKFHLLNEKEFWGDWVIPSISKDNPAFEEQDYWRGRIWAPMNLLVYLGLKKAGMDATAAELAEKSGELIMKEWKVNQHVHENYCAITGEGCNKENSEKYYSWGALLSYIYIDNKVNKY